MMDIIIVVLASFGAFFILLGAVGILRMPDTYLRMAVTTKAATLGVGLILIAAAFYFDDVATTTRVLAIIIFILLTAPVGAHLMGRASYIAGNKLWEKSVSDDLKGKYKASRNFSIAPEKPGKSEDIIENEDYDKN